MAEPTPWRALVRTALHFGIAPAQFWRLSLSEWRALIAPHSETLTRGAFDALAARFPDDRHDR